MVQSVNCNLYLYADDSALVITGKNINEIERQLSQNLESVSLWLEENKLSLHLGKTESIVFASNQKLKECNCLQISCNNIDIKSQNSVKYLGMVLDQNMNFETMGSSVISKINARIKFLYRKGIFFNRKEKKMLVSSLVQSSFDYACNSWYRGLAKKLKTKLQCAQNKLVRYILSYDCRQHLYFKDFSLLGWLDVENRVDYLSLGLMFSIYKQTAPSYLCNMDLISHTHRTRSNATFKLPHVKSQGAKTFRFNAIKLWNSLPLNIKTSETKELFKRRCKTFLMSKMESKENNAYVM